MKKILFLCLTALFVSCSAEEGWQERGAEESTLAEEFKNIANGYELMIKGYTLEELQEEKDETPKSDKVETVAEPWMIKAIRDSLEKTSFSYGNKTRADAQPYGGEVNKLGVFKFGSCYNNREFVYFMDCEDDGNSCAIGDIGSSEVGGNVVFKFCLVDPANYGGGALLLYNYIWDKYAGDVSTIERYHDNEDKRNKNEIMDNGGLASTGPTNFSANTKFFWIYFHGTSIRKLPFQYGVLGDNPPPLISHQIQIDDEDSRNGNEAILREHISATGMTYTRRLNDNEYYKGISASRNTTYSMKVFY